MNRYIEMNTFVSNNCIDIKEISVFETLIKENNVNTIFYGKRTARSKYNSIEGECFLFIIDSVFYVFTYHSEYGIYKTIEDYNNGLKYCFENALEFYFSKNRNIENYTNYNKYILNEYLINVMDIKNYDNEYYLNFIDIINEIEDIKEKYNFNTKEGIVCYNIIKNIENEGSYTINELYEICEYGIQIIGHKIRISIDFEKQFQKYVEEEEEDEFSNWNYKKIVGKWKFDADKFKIYIEKILQILKIEIKIE